MWKKIFRWLQPQGWSPISGQDMCMEKGPTWPDAREATENQPILSNEVYMEIKDGRRLVCLVGYTWLRDWCMWESHFNSFDSLLTPSWNKSCTLSWIGCLQKIKGTKPAQQWAASMDELRVQEEGLSLNQGSKEKWIAVPSPPEHALWSLLSLPCTTTRWHYKIESMNHQVSVKSICYTAVLWASHILISMSWGWLRCSGRMKKQLFVPPDQVGAFPHVGCRTKCFVRSRQAWWPDHLRRYQWRTGAMCYSVLK